MYNNYMNTNFYFSVAETMTVVAVVVAVAVVTISRLAAVPGSYVSVSLDYHCLVSSGNYYSPDSAGYFSVWACS